MRAHRLGRPENRHIEADRGCAATLSSSHRLVTPWEPVKGTDMNSYRMRVSAAAVSLSVLGACTNAGAIVGPGADFFKPCTNQALKVLTSDCGGYLGCPPGNTRIPVDVSALPAVAHMKVGMTGELNVSAVGNDSPKGCWPTFPGPSGTERAAWSTSDPAILSFTQRLDRFGQPTFPLTIFVNALAPGVATVYAQFRDSRVDFAHCSNEASMNSLDSCVPVGQIVVTP